MPDTVTTTRHPSLIVLGGPNGAGKSTCAPKLLRGTLAVDEFVNADTIAHGLSAFRPSEVTFEAGRVMLARLDALARSRVSFAFETTLASRSFAPWIARLSGRGYRFRLVYVWLSSPELALERVAERIRLGGHSVAPDVVVRRYARGLRNLFDLYMPLAFRWRVYDNSRPCGPRVVARGASGGGPVTLDPDLWARVLRSAGVR